MYSIRRTNILVTLLTCSICLSFTPTSVAGDINTKTTQPDVKCNSINDVDWIIGEWFYESSETERRSEVWKKGGERYIEGQGLKTNLINNETLTLEELNMFLMSGGVYYTAKIEANSMPVLFQLTKCNENQLLFENQQHDFPKKLDYRLKDENNMEVSVEGDQGGFVLKFTRA